MPDEKLARAIRCRTRRDILHILGSREKISVHEIAGMLNITEATASKNLKLLYDFGLIGCESCPPEKLYSLKVKELTELIRIYDKIVRKIATV